MLGEAYLGIPLTRLCAGPENPDIRRAGTNLGRHTIWELSWSQITVTLEEWAGVLHRSPSAVIMSSKTHWALCPEFQSGSSHLPYKMGTGIWIHSNGEILMEGPEFSKVSFHHESAIHYWELALCFLVGYMKPGSIKGPCEGSSGGLAPGITPACRGVYSQEEV